MKKPTIRAIFVDFGNVCATFDFHRFIENMSRAVKVPKKKVETALLIKAKDGKYVGYSPLFEAYECGEIEPWGLHAVLLRTLDRVGAIDYFSFERLWCDIWLEENLGLYLTLLEIDLPKYLLSNTNEIIYRNYMAKCGIVQRHIPDRRCHILSCEVGVIKPHPMIYKVALARAKVEPEEALFLDDMPENIDAWRALGGVGIVYHAGKDTIRSLQKEFRACGILKK